MCLNAFVYLCYINLYVDVGIGVEKTKNIAIIANINTIGKITNIHDTIDATFLHSMFNNHVQKNISIT